MADTREPAPPTKQRHNPVLVPGALLPVRALWQPVADSLPDQAMLVVVPTTDSPQRLALTAAALHLAAAGHRVVTLPAETFTATAGIQARLSFPG